MFSAAQAPRREPPERFAGFLPKSRRLRHGRKERQRKAGSESVNMPDVLLQDVFGGLLRNGACSTSFRRGNRRSASLVFFRKPGACGTAERNAGGKRGHTGRSFSGCFWWLAKERGVQHKLPQRKPPERLRHDGSSIGSLSPPSNSESANMPGVPWRTVLNGLLRNGACSATGYEEHPERRFPLLSGKQPL